MVLLDYFWVDAISFCSLSEWFRKDGTLVRSGDFEKREQTGLWTTYDNAGEVYKVTRMKPKKS